MKKSLKKTIEERLEALENIVGGGESLVILLDSSTGVARLNGEEVNLDSLSKNDVVLHMAYRPQKRWKPPSEEDVRNLE